MGTANLSGLTLRYDGIMIVQKTLQRQEVEELLLVCSAIRRQWLARDPLTGQPGGNERTETCMRHINHPAYFERYPERLRLILEACANQTVVSALRKSWKEEPVFRSTTLFFNPQQDQPAKWHRDSQFIYPDPLDEKNIILQRAGDNGSTVAQVQMSLIDSDDLEYVPGSQHRWDTPEELGIRLSADPGQRCGEEFPGAIRCASPAGDAVAFDPYGIHRGRYAAGVFRMTIMVTFVRASSRPELDRFSFQPWFLNDRYLDGLSPHATAVYERFVERYRHLWGNTNHTFALHSGRRS